MKTRLIAVAAAALLPLAGAHGGTLTLGGPLALNCYQAALERGATIAQLNLCTRSLLEEPLETDDRAATFVNRGILYKRRGQHAEAEADFDRALQLMPTLADAWLNKGFLHLAQGRGRTALPLIEKSLELRTRRPALALFARGIAHEQTGNLKAAYADLSRARQLEPAWDAPAEALERYRVRER